MIKALDATQILLPNALKTEFPAPNNKCGLKIHTMFCLKDNIPEQAIITDAKLSDIIAAKKNVTFLSGVTYVFDRGYYDFGWWNLINKSGAYFVTRLKKHTKPTFKRAHSCIFSKNVISDHVVRLERCMSGGRKNPYQQELRRVVAKNNEGKEIQIITNDFTSTADEIAAKYSQRWQIELFFKWLKQNLKIKKFYGKSSNAIKTQVYIALIAYVLLKLLYESVVTGFDFRTFVNIIKARLLSRMENLWQPFVSSNRRCSKISETRQLSLFNWGKSHA